MNSTADALDDDNNGSGTREFNVPYPMGGKRLLGAFAVTDCLQILTGRVRLRSMRDSPV